MKEIKERQKREKYLAINTPITIRVSKSFSTNLYIKALTLGVNQSELMRTILEVGCKQLNWDLDKPI
tara:strand:- start:48 stop:248 length:201 start_codon:yes stop_codon:yes gene_type:complete